MQVFGLLEGAGCENLVLTWGVVITFSWGYLFCFRADVHDLVLFWSCEATQLLPKFTRVKAYNFQVLFVFSVHVLVMSGDPWCSGCWPVSKSGVLKIETIDRLDKMVGFKFYFAIWVEDSGFSTYKIHQKLTRSLVFCFCCCFSCFKILKLLTFPKCGVLRIKRNTVWLKWHGAS